MKDILKKNQVIIAALAIMICVAGYLNFTQDKIENKDAAVSSKDAITNTKSDTGISDKDATVIPDASDNSEETTVETDKVLKENETDITDESDSKTEKSANASDTNEVKKNDNSTKNDTSTKTTDNKDSVGDAVLANSSVSNEFFASAKLKREQTRAKSKETLLQVINNKNISEDQKQKAIDEMIKITGYTDKETHAETMLEAKGFKDTVVTMSDDSVDVVVNCNNLTEQQMAQIEDIVKRQTEISAEKIVISPAKVTTDQTDNSSKKTESKKAETKE
ncbi:stage III sporulation protein AH [Lachnospiraceae bacterium KM106-2]|nr:stage III sporulation protein AH [Lachnospiraceae bacterium KM106-2]